MDPNTLARYRTLCQALRTLPFDEAVMSPEYAAVFELLRLLNPSARPLELLGEPGNPLRERIEDLLKNCDQAATGEANLGGLRPPPLPSSGSPDVAHTPVLQPLNDLVAAGGFRLLQEVGKGGLGRVFLAEPVNIHDAPRLAIKLLHRTDLTSQTIGALSALQEAQAGYGLKHPNLVRVESCGRSNLGPYVAMEYVEGKSLAQCLKEVAPRGLGERQAAEVVVVIASAVAAAYASGKQLVHRDIKPSNILGAVLTNTGDDTRSPAVLDVARLKLGDFGIAQHAGLATADGAEISVYGTLGYMPPEQMTGDPSAKVTAAVDVFALAMTLLELAAGSRPFSAPEDRELDLIRHTLRNPGLNREKIAQLREEYAALLDPDRLTARIEDRYLRAICRKALALDPASRYATTGELADELRRWLVDRPAERSGYQYRFWDRARLLVRRARRKDPVSAPDQATVWGVGFLVLAPWSVVLSGLCTLQILHGADKDAAAQWTSAAYMLVLLTVGLLLTWLTRGGEVVTQTAWCYGAIAGAVEVLRQLILPDEYGKLSAAILLVVGLAMTVMGLFSPVWRLQKLFGIGVMVAAAALAKPFQSPAWHPYTSVIIGSCYALVFVMLGMRQLRLAGELPVRLSSEGRFGSGNPTSK